MIAAVACGPRSPAASTETGALPRLDPLPPALAGIVELDPCNYRRPGGCLAPPRAGDEDTNVQRYPVASACTAALGTAVTEWAAHEALEFIGGTLTPRRLSRFYLVEPQAFYELLYSVPEDGTNMAEIFVGVTAPSQEQRGRVKAVHGSPDALATWIRSLTEPCR